MPDGATFARLLATKAEYPGSPSDALTKVAQYLEEVAADRPFLLDQIATAFFSNIRSGYSSSVTDFLRSIPRGRIPDLIVTTNYDVTVEMTLEHLSVPYFAVAHIIGDSKYRGRLFCYEQLTGSSAILTLTQVNERLIELENFPTENTIVYKMHGSSRPANLADRVDSIVLTENDYIRFLAQDTFRSIPLKIQEKLKEARLLYLGYSLQDWNFRVLLNRIREMQRGTSKSGERRHWACLLNPDPVEAKFWAQRGVTLYSVDLAVFLGHLGAHLGLE